MSPDDSEDGWAMTAAGRYTVYKRLTALAEILHVRSHRGVRQDLGLSPFEAQTVAQLALRLRL